MAKEFDESKHPRDKNGKFSEKEDKAEKLRKAEQIYSSEKIENTIPNAYKFNRLHTSHHKDHAIEMGYKNQKDYESAAVNFWEKGKGEFYFGQRRRDCAKYNPKTQEYMICDLNGNIKSYYKITEKILIK